MALVMVSRYIILFLLFIAPIYSMEDESCELESFEYLKPVALLDDDINNLDPVAQPYNLRTNTTKRPSSESIDDVHEITYRLPQRIDRGKMPKLLPDYSSDGQETNEYHCIRARCTALVFFYAQDLLTHYEQKHSLQSFYRCVRCKKECDTKHHLQRHAMQEHSSKMPATCPICKKQLHAPGSLNRHLKEVHPSSK